MIRTVPARRVEVLFLADLDASLRDRAYGVFDALDPANHPGVSRLVFYLDTAASEGILFPQQHVIDGAPARANIVTLPAAMLAAIAAPVDTYVRSRISSPLPDDQAIYCAWLCAPAPTQIRYLEQPVLAQVEPDKSKRWAVIEQQAAAAGIGPVACYGLDDQAIVIPDDVTPSALDQFRVLLRLAGLN